MISVILCTHNPDPARLALALGSLRAQTLPAAEWKLVVVDNASSPALAAAALSASGPASMRVIAEPRPGLTPARLRGIRSTTGELLVFVDDDNVLAPDYLATAAALSRAHPYLGVWGGQLLPRFEQPPPRWTEAYWSLLALRPLERDRWSNLPDFSWCPWGAGLTLRRAVATAYAARVEASAFARAFGRRPNSLGGSEDLDIAMTACDLGLGYGLFQALRLEHLIPPERLQEAYLLRLREAGARTDELLRLSRGLAAPQPPPTWRDRLHDGMTSIGQSARRRRFAQAERRGRAAAHTEWLHRASTTS